MSSTTDKQEALHDSHGATPASDTKLVVGVLAGLIALLTVLGFAIATYGFGVFIATMHVLVALAFAFTLTLTRG